MLAAVSSNEVWQKIVDFFTITVKDFFVELLAENPPIKFILLVAGAALVLIGLIVIIAVCAKKNKVKKAAKKAARQSVKDAKKASKSGKVAAEEKPAVKARRTRDTCTRARCGSGTCTRALYRGRKEVRRRRFR